VRSEKKRREIGDWGLVIREEEKKKVPSEKKKRREMGDQ
jgi:hypothetical protein